MLPDYFHDFFLSHPVSHPVSCLLRSFYLFGLFADSDLLLLEGFDGAALDVEAIGAFWEAGIEEVEAFAVGGDPCGGDAGVEAISSAFQPGIWRAVAHEPQGVGASKMPRQDRLVN